MKAILGDALLGFALALCFLTFVSCEAPRDMQQRLPAPENINRADGAYEHRQCAMRGGC